MCDLGGKLPIQSSHLYEGLTECPEIGQSGPMTGMVGRTLPSPFAIEPIPEASTFLDKNVRATVLTD